MEERERTSRVVRLGLVVDARDVDHGVLLVVLGCDWKEWHGVVRRRVVKRRRFVMVALLQCGGWEDLRFERREERGCAMCGCRKRQLDLQLQ